MRRWGKCGGRGMRQVFQVLIRRVNPTGTCRRRWRRRIRWRRRRRPRRPRRLKMHPCNFFVRHGPYVICARKGYNLRTRCVRESISAKTRYNSVLDSIVRRLFRLAHFSTTTKHARRCEHRSRDRLCFRCEDHGVVRQGIKTHQRRCHRQHPGRY